jgi:hypothetical protein
MNRLSKSLVGISSALLLSACVTPHAYVDPQYRKATYDQIERLAQPVPVKVQIEFQRNGIPLPAVEPELRGHVERTLRASGVFVPASDASASISVTANNIADLAAARAKGFGTGLTFGAAGSTVDDNYEFSCSFVRPSQTAEVFSYQHAIHTTIGNADGPPGLSPTTLADAVGRVVEDVILNFVHDLQERRLVQPAGAQGT